MDNVPTSVIVWAIIIFVLIAWLTIWVTNKAYSKRWDEE